MNVVVVVMDSLRADHIYGPRARTAAMNKVMQEGVRFTNAYPEGMPTIPARRAIMAGRRTFPFRGWKPKWDDLPLSPAGSPSAATVRCGPRCSPATAGRPAT